MRIIEIETQDLVSASGPGFKRKLSSYDHNLQQKMAWPPCSLGGVGVSAGVTDMDGNCDSKSARPKVPARPCSLVRMKVGL